MKQFIETLIPDKATAWKMASMTLLLLLVVVLLVNTVVPFFAELFSIGGSQAEIETPKHLIADINSEAVTELQNHAAQLSQEIDRVNGDIQKLSAEKAELENTIAELQNQNQAAAGEIQELQSQLELQALQLERLETERDLALKELEALRESLAMDYTVVVRLTRLNVFGAVADTLYFSMHVTPEQYATYQIGAKVEPFGDLEYPLNSNWSGEVSNMFVNLKEL